MSKIVKIITMLTGLFCCFSLQTMASRRPDLMEMSLEDLLNIPIVAASIISEKPSETPANAIVVTEETIKNRGYRNLIDLLQDIPMIEIGRRVTAGNSQSLTVMGINKVERFQIMIDGIRVTPVTGNLYVPGQQFSLQNAKQVEIIIGPMSAIYGADVFNGVVNIVTKTGAEMDNSSIQVSAGSFGTIENSMSIGFPTRKKQHLNKKGTSIAISLSNHASDGPFMPKYFPNEFSWYNNQFQAGKMLLGPGIETIAGFRPYQACEKADFMHLRLCHRDFEFGIIKMSEQHSSSVGVLPQYSLYIEDALFKTSHYTLYGKHSYACRDDRFKLQSQISHHFYEVDPKTAFYNSFSGYKPAYKYARDKSFIIEERLSYKIDSKKNLLMGLSYQSNSSLPRTADLTGSYDTNKGKDDQGFIYPGSQVFPLLPQGIPLDIFQIKYDNFGSYAQLHLKAAENCMLIFGARYDHNSLYGSSFNPRAGMVYNPNDKTNIKLMHGTAFLAPPPDNAYAHFGSFVPDPTNPGDIKSFYLHIPNPALKPEKIQTSQAEASYSIKKNLKLTLNLYRSDVSDLHQVTSLGAGIFKGKSVDNLAQWNNFGKARAYGGTLKIDGLSRYNSFGLNYFAAYTISRGDIADEPLPYSSERSVKGGLTYLKNRFTLSSRIIYQSECFTRDRNSSGERIRAPAFTTADAYLSYRLTGNSSNNISAFVRVENIADRRYYHPGFADGGVGFNAAPQYPRSISGGMLVEF